MVLVIIVLNASVTNITSHMAQLIGDDLQEFCLPLFYLPTQLKQGDIIKIKIQKLSKYELDQES